MYVRNDRQAVSDCFFSRHWVAREPSTTVFSHESGVWGATSVVHGPWRHQTVPLVTSRSQTRAPRVTSLGNGHYTSTATKLCNVQGPADRSWPSFVAHACGTAAGRSTTGALRFEFNANTGVQGCRQQAKNPRLSPQTGCFAWQPLYHGTPPWWADTREALLWGGRKSRRRTHPRAGGTAAEMRREEQERFGHLWS